MESFRYKMRQNLTDIVSQIKQEVMRRTSYTDIYLPIMQFKPHFYIEISLPPENSTFELYLKILQRGLVKIGELQRNVTAYIREQLVSLGIVFSTCHNSGHATFNTVGNVCIRDKRMGF